MSTKPYRWMMVEPGRPMVRTEFEIGELAADQVVVEVAGLRRLPHRSRLLLRRRAPTSRCRSRLGHEISGRVVGAGSAWGSGSAARWSCRR